MPWCENNRYKEFTLLTRHNCRTVGCCQALDKGARGWGGWIMITCEVTVGVQKFIDKVAGRSRWWFYDNVSYETGLF